MRTIGAVAFLIFLIVLFVFSDAIYGEDMMNKVIYQPQGNIYLKPKPPKGGSSQQEDGQNYKWIRVDEKLPQQGQKVLVSYDIHGVGKKVDVSYYDKHGFLIGIVDAWMPLPEPYKGGKNDDLS